MKRLTSWVESANNAHTHFPLNNLPYGVFSTDEGPRCGVAIGDLIVDLCLLEEEGVIQISGEPMLDAPFFNEMMELGPKVWAELRARVTELLILDGDDALSGDPDLLTRALVTQEDATMHLPIVVTEFTDFYSGRHHATNVGTMFRGAENALPPNWLHMPIGYNGRASTVVISETAIRRPWGQLKPKSADVPYLGPSKRLDMELELGAILGTGVKMGQPVSVAEADGMIFGYVILNDWSARDIQAWEYQPLGPFQAKAFATSISPWIVTAEALAPFRVADPVREIPLLPYLNEAKPMLYDISLEVDLTPDDVEQPTTITRTNAREMYYSAAQQLCHHAIGGCQMNTGDLLGSGTISGPDPQSRGSLLELSWGGKQPLTLDGGQERSFLEDGDTVTMSGFSQGPDYRIGFGQCSGKIAPAIAQPEWSK
jgi:fumarylacetoacetase